MAKVVYETKPVKNYLKYWWHIFAKIVSFALFGIGTVLISIVAFPVMKCIFWGKRRFNKAARRFISYMFRFFTWFMFVIRASTVKTNDGKKFTNLSGCVVVANHPSLLDVVMLISRIPNADCVVNASLSGKNIVHIITRTLYISNNLPYDEFMERCEQSIKDGNALIIFPEGTRSLITGQNPFKKGAARVAIKAGCPVVPVFMGGNDKVGLRKNDSMFLYNPVEVYKYEMYMKEPVLPQEYADLPEPAAAKRMTAKLAEVLSYESNAENMRGVLVN